MPNSEYDNHMEEKASDLDAPVMSKTPIVDADSEKASLEEPAQPIPDPAPDGGLRAWLVVIGATCIIFCTLGFVNSYGTLQEYYQTHQLADESPSKISWIGSLGMFLQFFAGMFSGPLFDRYGAKVMYFPAFIYVLSMMLLSLCTKFWHFMLLEAVIMGLSMGLMQFPAYAAVMHYWDKRRAAALGIVVSGSSLGGVVMPLILSKMLNDSTLGFGWSIRIVGFIILPLLLFACLVVRGRLPPRKSSFWLLSAFKDKKYVMLVVALFFLLFGTFTPFFYLPTFAVESGLSQTNAGYLPAVINAASTVSRIGLGILADKTGRVNMLAFGGLMTTIMVFVMSSISTSAGFWIYAAFFGFASGTTISSAAAALSTCPSDMRTVGTYIGMGYAIAGLGSLIGPPVNGVLVTEYASFFQVSMFSGAICTVGTLLTVAAKFYVPGGLISKG